MNSEIQIEQDIPVVRFMEHRPCPDLVVPLTLDKQIDGLNNAAKIRGKLYTNGVNFKGEKINQGLIDFIAELKQPSNNKERSNKRILDMIFFLAEINKERHHLEYCQLNEGEQRSLIEVINQLKVIALMFPNDLAIK